MHKEGKRTPLRVILTSHLSCFYAKSSALLRVHFSCGDGDESVSIASFPLLIWESCRKLAVTHT